MPILVLGGPTWQVAALPEAWAPAARTGADGPTTSRQADAEVWPVTSSPGSHAPLIPALRSGSLNVDATAATAFTPATAAAILPGPRPPVQELTAASGRAFLGGCVTCHNGKMRTANLALDELDLERVGERPEIWEKVVRRLRAGSHPPAGISRPTRAAADAFGGSIEAALDRSDRAN